MIRKAAKIHQVRTLHLSVFGALFLHYFHSVPSYCWTFPYIKGLEHCSCNYWQNFTHNSTVLLLAKLNVTGGESVRWAGHCLFMPCCIRMQWSVAYNSIQCYFLASRVLFTSFEWWLKWRVDNGELYCVYLISFLIGRLMKLSSSSPQMILILN